MDRDAWLIVFGFFTVLAIFGCLFMFNFWLGLASILFIGLLTIGAIAIS